MPIYIFFYQLVILTGEELRELLWRRKSLLSLIAYVGIVVGSMWLLNHAHGVLSGGNTSNVASLVEDQGFIKFLQRLGLSESIIYFVQLAALPHEIWIFQLFSLLWFPTLVAMVSCDMVSVDIYRGTLRFVLLRTSRLVYYLSKSISHLLFFTLLQFFSLLGVILLTAAKQHTFVWKDGLWLAANYFIVFIPFLWTMIAATQWISSWSRKPLSALIRIHVLWVLFIFIAAKAAWLTPLNPKIGMGLILPFEQFPLLSFFGYTLWACIFTFIGLLGFLRRDV